MKILEWGKVTFDFTGEEPVIDMTGFRFDMEGERVDLSEVASQVTIQLGLKLIKKNGKYAEVIREAIDRG